MKALAVAAGIVFWTLVLGTAFLAFFPGSDAGEPVAILTDRTGHCAGGRGRATGRRRESLITASRDADDGMDLPPGFRRTPGRNARGPGRRAAGSRTRPRRWRR